LGEVNFCRREIKYSLRFQIGILNVALSKAVKKMASVTYLISMSYNGQEKLPGHRQNPNFFYEVFLGLTSAKNKEKRIILN
jgi:hypothetical protein